MSATSTTSRVLRLLELLQARTYWSGPELADRLQTTPRTVRRDIDRLRDLGYRISTRRGSHGGYALAPGSELPPMVFSDDEAVAIAVALSTAAAGTAVTGLAELAVSALVKVEQVLPARLRRRVSAVRAATAPAVPVLADPVAPETLTVLALACRDGERLRLRYTSAEGEQSRRHVEPVKLVPRARRWYLVCWDLGREDWRTLRADRISHVLATGQRGTPRELPVADAADFVDRRFGSVRPEHTAVVIIHAPLETTRAYLGRYVRDLGAQGDRTRWVIHDARLEVLAAALVWLPWPFHILDCPDLVVLLHDVGRRFLGAAAPDEHTEITRIGR